MRFLHVFAGVAMLAAAEAPTLRLPAHAKPERYRLNLTVVPDKDTFTGAVEIELKVSEPTTELWLNVTDLQIKQAKLTSHGETIAATVIPTPKNYVGFSFAQQLTVGPATLHVDYAGSISRKNLTGIYQIKDKDHWYVYTQFEPTDARRAWPCFDEPAYKVPWQITLNVPKDTGAFSNTPVVSESAGEMKTIRFAETKPMPSYLVAFAVGPFEIADAGKAGKKNTAVRMIVPRGRVSEARYAVEVTPSILKLLEDYFGIPYPYEKLDQVAIPVAGYAMEHPGLVTYGQRLILSKPSEDTLGRQRDYTNVAAHELAHQWFGGLVTMEWWDDTWLKEGFASWMADKVVNQLRPEWRARIDELRYAQMAMGVDGLVSARKVRQPIQSADDIDNAFDGITYSKGSALLSMYESYVSEEQFRKGIQRYLNKYSFRNATSEDFLTAIGGESGVIARSFSTFLDQAGVPLVTATLKCDGGRPRLALSQQRFLPIGSKGSASQTWQIPICVKYESAGAQTSECFLLTEPEKELPLSKAAACPAWISANAGQTGYYRVLYKDDLLNKLLQQDRNSLSLPERVGLLGDVSALTKGGQMPMDAALALVPKFGAERERALIESAMRIHRGIEGTLVPENLRPNYRRFVRGVYRAHAKELGWRSKPGEGDETRLLRPALIGVVANDGEDPEFLGEAKQLALAWLKDRNAIDSDMIDVTLRAAARHGDSALFDAFHAAAKKAPERRERRELLNAMGSFEDPEIIKQALPVVLSNEFDTRESITILSRAAGSYKTREVAYQFVKDHFANLAAKMPVDYGANLPFFANGFCDAAHLADVSTFFEGRSTKYTGGPRNLAQVLEGISLCGAYKRIQQPSVEAFLGKY